MKGNADTGSNFDNALFPEGVYPMTLKRAFVMWGKPSQYAPEGAPKIGMIWEYDDGEGEPAELMDFLTFPKNFGYNDKSNFWKRLGEIAAVTINKENVGDVDMDFGEFIDTYDELVEHVRASNDQGRPEKAEVKGILVGAQELIGKKCQLVVKVWERDGKEGNNVASVMQVGVSQRPVRTGRAAPAQATAPSSQRLMDAPKPAPRPSTTEPLHEADLPY